MIANEKNSFFFMTMERHGLILFSTAWPDVYYYIQVIFPMKWFFCPFTKFKLYALFTYRKKKRKIRTVLNSREDVERKGRK